MPSSACDWSSDVCSSDRSEEHTSELQSRSDLVCRLLLEKKKHTADLQSRSEPVSRLLLEKPHHCATARSQTMMHTALQTHTSTPIKHTSAYHSSPPIQPT